MKQESKEYNFVGKRYAPYSDERSGIGGKYKPTRYGVYDNEKNVCIESCPTFDSAQEIAHKYNVNGRPNLVTKQSKTVSDNLFKDAHLFLKEWTPEQFKEMEQAISRHFSNKPMITIHGNYPPMYLRFNAVDQRLGLAYTSSSSCAGFCICNTEIYNNQHTGYHYIGFAMDLKGKSFAILWDKDENEIIIPL